MNPQELLGVYREETAHLRRSPVRSTAQVLADLDAFGAWCTAQGVDPRVWIRARHRSMGAAAEARGGRPPVIKPQHLIRPQFLDAYWAWQGDQAAAELEQERVDVVDDIPRTGAELHPLAETQKRVLAGDPEACRASSWTATLGWTPASVWCARCPVAVACRDALPVEVRRARGG